MRIPTRIYFAFLIRSGGSVNMHMAYNMHWRWRRARRLSAATPDIFTPAPGALIASRNSDKADDIKDPCLRNTIGCSSRQESRRCSTAPLDSSCMLPAILCWLAASTRTAEISLDCSRL